MGWHKMHICDRSHLQSLVEQLVRYLNVGEALAQLVQYLFPNLSEPFLPQHDLKALLEVTHVDPLECG